MAGEVIAPPPPEDLEMEAAWREWRDAHPHWYGKTARVGFFAGWRARADQVMSDSIRAVVDDVIAEHHGRVATHWDGCWKWHAACLAYLIRGHLDEAGGANEPDEA